MADMKAVLMSKERSILFILQASPLSWVKHA